MSVIAVTQRVDIVQRGSGAAERRDALDQAWPVFLEAAGALAIPAPNNARLAIQMMQDLPIDGLLLTGGNDLVAHGGDAPERDAADNALLAFCRACRVPVIGVCRGMQLIQVAFGVGLEPVEGHVSPAQIIDIEGAATTVNAYHRWGARSSPDALETWATAPDGVIKAVRHRTERIIGLMWHPERILPFDERDLELFRQTFVEDAAA